MSGVDLHWFLPINGDSRQLVGGGHGVGTGSAGLLRQASLDYLASVARRRPSRSGSPPHSRRPALWCEDAWLTTAMLVAAHRAVEVPRRLPPRVRLADPRGATGRDLPTAFAGTAAAQRRHRWRGAGAARLRRLPRQGRPLPEDGGVPATSCAALWRGETVDHDGVHIQVEGAFLDRLPDPVPSVYFGGSSPAAGEVAARARRRLPHLGRAARAGRARRSRGSARSRPARPARSASASGCT